ncbi:MAG: ferrochelatase [Candidatus Nitricoxidivorans perseverans]|uniref:Ferrochelatase n=1 Tax=Candidatus Nitricoxidivorans perseverans TaxID=2975601 RepID=A0AA49FKM7_9PROT|nr:MAG: ferrochelatase [Candidatus Nitricoxidivorans perseverans]
MKQAVLLVNLGTPEAPTAPALRKYLAEFLGDPRVVDLPRWQWWPILHGIILNTRPKKSAEKYAKIWTPEGSPLKVHTERQAKLLRGLLGQRGIADVAVGWAMRYGQPSVAGELDRLAREGAKRILVLPLYPQFSGSTTASTIDAVEAWRRQHPGAPELIQLRDFHDHPGYIAALAASIGAHWERNGRAEKLVMSFHGIPKRMAERGDPYADQCARTAELLAAALELSRNAWRMTFQSRLGRAEWLQPYTQPTLEQLAHDGTGSVDVVCPGFPADCLETLEEIAMECKAAFIAAGGREFNYIPCLNERDDWIAALADIAMERLA